MKRFVRRNLLNSVSVSLNSLNRFSPIAFAHRDFDIQNRSMDVDRLPAAAREKYETSCATLLPSSFDVSEGLKLTEQVVRGLLGHVNALRQLARDEHHPGGDTP